jgi:Protein of unknown function (DUF2442)
MFDTLFRDCFVPRNDKEKNMPLFSSRKEEKKVKVTFANGLLFVEREDGRQKAFPLEFFPKLMNATDEERGDWVQTDKGIHWNGLDIDISL